MEDTMALVQICGKGKMMNAIESFTYKNSMKKAP
jgi:hypothetical protein